MPRPLCKCGCGESIPIGNQWYANKEHERESGFYGRLAAQGRKAIINAWKPGGGNRKRYIERVRARLQHLVPRRDLFGRDEVLILCNKARTEGYETGYRASTAAHKRARRLIA